MTAVPVETALYTKITIAGKAVGLAWKIMYACSCNQILCGWHEDPAAINYLLLRSSHVDSLCKLEYDIIHVRRKIIEWMLTWIRYTESAIINYVLNIKPMQGSSPLSFRIASWYALWERMSFWDGFASDIGWLWYHPTSTNPFLFKLSFICTWDAPSS